MEILDTEVKYISFNYKDAPVITENYGDLVKMLDKVLVEGFNINTILHSEKQENNRFKIYLPVGHGYVTEQVVNIYNTNTVFNNDFRVLNVAPDSITIQLDINLTDIIDIISTDDVKIKTASLGFKNVYSNTSKTTMCFKNTSQNFPGVIKVIDEIPPNGYGASWCKYARVVMGFNVDDTGNFIDNMKTPVTLDFPSAEKTGNGVSGESGIHGFAKWKYAITDDYYARECFGTVKRDIKAWDIIGDSNTFYLILYSGMDSSVLGFGNIKGEGFDNPISLQATDGFYKSDNTNMGGQYGKTYNNWGRLNSNNTGSFLMTNVYGNLPSPRYLKYYCTGLCVGTAYTDRPWLSSELQTYNPFSGKLTTGKLYIKDTDNYMRGYHRGLNIFYGKGFPSQGRLLGTEYIVLNMTDPLRESIMPLMFSLKNWEEV